MLGSNFQWRNISMSDYEKRELLKIDLRQNTLIDTVQKKKKINNSSSLKINLHNFQVIPTDQPQLVFPTTNGPHSDIYLMFWEIKETEKLMHYLQVASLEPCYNFPLCSPYSIIFQLPVLFNHRGKLYTLWPNSFRIGHNKWMKGKKHIPRILL